MVVKTDCDFFYLPWKACPFSCSVIPPPPTNTRYLQNFAFLRRIEGVLFWACLCIEWQQIARGKFGAFHALHKETRVGILWGLSFGLSCSLAGYSYPQKSSACMLVTVVHHECSKKVAMLSALILMHHTQKPNPTAEFSPCRLLPIADQQTPLTCMHLQSIYDAVYGSGTAVQNLQQGNNETFQSCFTPPRSWSIILFKLLPQSILAHLMLDLQTSSCRFKDSDSLEIYFIVSHEICCISHKKLMKVVEGPPHQGVCPTDPWICQRTWLDVD